MHVQLRRHPAQGAQTRLAHHWKSWEIAAAYPGPVVLHRRGKGDKRKNETISFFLFFTNAYAHTTAIFLKKFDASSLDRLPDFPGRLLSSTQLTVN
jgi:hypothetical protein